MGYDTRYEKIKSLLRRRFYLGLFVFLPVFFSIFALATPLIFLVKFKTVLQHNVISPGELAALYGSVEGWMYIFTAVAFVSGLLVAYGLVRPAKKLLKEETVDKDIEEFSALGREFTEIATSFRKYASLLESTTGGVIAVNKKGEITMSNQHACHTLGFSESDIAGKNIDSLLDISKDLDKAMSGEIVSSELNTTVNGEKRTIGYTLSPIKSRESIDGVVFNFKDITRMKEMEHEMLKTERLASIGSLAMEVAHEVRNPLASIRGLAQLIGEDIKDDDQKKLYINTILKETERLNRVVDTLFEKRASSTEADNLREIIHRIVLLCGHAVKGKIVRVREEYDELSDKTQVRDERLFHAIYNIVLNAHEAVMQNGEISIKAKTIDGGTTVEVCSDSELSPEIMADRIFEGDVTTKGKGRGIGLKIAMDAIRNIGGDIRVEAAEGKTKFIIRLAKT